MGGASTQRVRVALEALGLASRVVTLPSSTRTAREAADAIGCSVGQIAKSLVFECRETSRPVLAIMSGSNRVDVDKLAAASGEPVGKADADFVRSHTGFAIGGVPPVGHAAEVRIFLDRDLFHYEKIWAAAGDPFSVFSLTPADLERATEAPRVDLREES